MTLPLPAECDYSAILKLAAYTGLRLGELLGVQWQDVDLEGRELHVRRQWTRMGQVALLKTPKAVRRVPIPDDINKFLAAHKLRSQF